jgi:hypothetical protein
MNQQRRRVIPIRDELNSWNEAKRQLENYGIQDPYVPEHKSEAERVSTPQERRGIEFELDPDSSHWSPFEVNDLASKRRLFEDLEEYMDGVFRYQQTQDRTLKYIVQPFLHVLKTFTDPRGINPPEYSLKTTPGFVKELEDAFANHNLFRIITWLQVGQHGRAPEFNLLVVFYRKLDSDILVIELYHPDLPQMEDHPAFDKLPEQLAALVEQVQSPQSRQKEALIGILDSDVSNEEWSGYLPFVARYNTVPDFMFGYLWNAFLFMDRVCEPKYTLKEVKQIMYGFGQIDVDVRKKIYLAFLFFVIRFRWYLYISELSEL